LYCPRAISYSYKIQERWRSWTCKFIAGFIVKMANLYVLQMRSIGANCSSDKTCCILGRQYSNKWIQVGLLQRRKICGSWGNWEVLGLGQGICSIFSIVYGELTLGSNSLKGIWRLLSLQLFWFIPFNVGFCRIDIDPPLLMFPLQLLELEATQQFSR
jgi:hypothetical protein